MSPDISRSIFRSAVQLITRNQIWWRTWWDVISRISAASLTVSSVAGRASDRKRRNRPEHSLKLHRLRSRHHESNRRFSRRNPFDRSAAWRSADDGSSESSDLLQLGGSSDRRAYSRSFRRKRRGLG